MYDYEDEEDDLFGPAPQKARTFSTQNIDFKNDETSLVVSLKYKDICGNVYRCKETIEISVNDILSTESEPLEFNLEPYLDSSYNNQIL